MLAVRRAILCLATLPLAVPALGQFPDDFGPDPFEDAIEIFEEGDLPPQTHDEPGLLPLIAPQDDVTPTSAELLQRSDEVLRSADEVKTILGDPQPAVPEDEPPLRLVPEDLHLGRAYFVGEQSRYLAMRVWLVNTTSKPITIQREAFRLLSRGNELKPGIAQRQGLTRLPAGTRFIDLNEISQTGDVNVPAHGATSLSLGFSEIPGTTEVPEMTLRVPVGSDSAIVDLNRFSLGLMRLHIERIGPRGLLALMRISGEITPVGAGELVRVLEHLANNKANRIVLAWDENAPTLHPDLSNWLVQAALRAGGVPANDGQHPVLAASIRELHLATLPSGTGVPNYVGPRRVHDTVAAAVTAAVGHAFHAMPLEELLREIESGHPLTRTAAIAAGGRLPDERLPMLLELTGDADPEIAKAAIVALRGFGSPAAIDRLVHLAKQGPTPVRSAAVESLAASRFGDAHRALRGLLESSLAEDPLIPPESLVPVLAEYPRPLWDNVLYDLAMQAEPSVRADALIALSKLGHTDLLTALEAAVQHDDSKLRTRAFALMARRNDAESLRMATEYTRRHLATEPPTREMYLLLVRTKDPQAIPLLIERLGDKNANRSDLIRLLSQIGGLEIRETLESAYPVLDPPVKAIALNTLAQLRSPRFYEFAEEALLSSEPALVSVAQQRLQANGGPEAVALLTRTLLESDNEMAMTYAAQGLGGIASPEARAAIRRIAHRNDERGRAAAREWFKLLSGSVALEPFRAAELARSREDWKAAVERYSDAVELDPQLIDAWSGRANAHMQLADYDAARSDYEKAFELDPHDPAAATCLGILRVFEGQVEEGLSFVRDRSGTFQESQLFAYNTACLYAVAAERLDRNDATRAERLRSDAVKELNRAVALGMTDPDDVSWMRKDPDLKSLQGRPDFEAAVAAAEKGSVTKTNE